MPSVTTPLLLSPSSDYAEPLECGRPWSDSNNKAATAVGRTRRLHVAAVFFAGIVVGAAAVSVAPRLFHRGGGSPKIAAGDAVSASNSIGEAGSSQPFLTPHVAALPLGRYPKAPFNNSCLFKKPPPGVHPLHTIAPPTKNAPQTFLADCAEWVVNSTDAVWNLPIPRYTDSQWDDAADRVLREKWEKAVVDNFYEGFISNSESGTEVGHASLRRAILGRRRRFPNLRIAVTDVFCMGNDIDGYKTSMADILSATDPLTGRTATWTGIAVTYVQKVDGMWKYVAEWVLHDWDAMREQFGLAKKPAPPKPVEVIGLQASACQLHFPSWGWQP